MNFKEIVLLEKQQFQADMSTSEKQDSLKTSMRYIFWQEFLENINYLLAPDESIMGYLPLTTAGNMTVSNQGLGGLSYARSEKAREYIELFQDIRGNRLLVFTDKRLLFFVMIDYLDEQSYFSYPYEKIATFTWKQRKLLRHESVDDPEVLFYGFFDFQSDTNIFSEVLTKKDYQLFLAFHGQIPDLNKIPIDEKIHRKNALDRVLSNWHLGYVMMKAVNIIFIFIFILLLLGLFLNFGPFKGFYYKHFQTAMMLRSHFLL